MRIITAALVILVMAFAAVTPASARTHPSHKTKPFHLKKVRHRSHHHHPTFMQGDYIYTPH